MRESEARRPRAPHPVAEEAAMPRFSRLSLVLAIVSVVALIIGGHAHAQSVLRVVMHSDLKIVDPIWTGAYITRNHGYMIYDTLFAMDAKGDIRPQMVDK